MLVAGQVSARNHVSNCLTDEAYKWHQNHLSLHCFIKANEESGLINYYRKADVTTKITQGRGPWIQVHATQIIVSGAYQFPVGTAYDYNGNLAPLRFVKLDDAIEFQNVSYFLVTDAECELKPIGSFSPSEKLDPAELCRIKNK